MPAGDVARRRFGCGASRAEPESRRKKILRVLAVAKRGRWVGIEAAGDAEERIAFGWDLRTPSPHPIQYVDSIAEEAYRPEGEDEKGIPVHQHPDVLLLNNPQLVGTVDRFRTGARREIDAHAWETLTHREIESVLVMANAASREEVREQEDLRRRLEHPDGASSR